ncbi:NAD-dependent epimerase/dehydratase family protein [Telmatospirillum siberiense]|uniref:NAD-dependent epimerase/dehydratase domain-containing protein n=1 Tax=Telmatospirillum siberiense TaxID=382514 RepID=A0A2N3PUP6_9PROT|nr:NAD-dependent epimerase/dehydratase family protein [Telmatospirillum siberiense]PKU24126.1 hypothetical protein CWS72_13270 [Telmatospirillum siberiense]
MEDNDTVLVLGASGGIGGELSRQLRDIGWAVRALRRTPRAASVSENGMTWLTGDALNRRDVAAAADGCSVIVHAVNPPGYRHWSELVLPMLDNTIAAATRSGATILLPGTIYNYGPDAFPMVTEESPQHPVTRKGAIRVEMERRLREYARNGGRVLIVRTGDFFGPKARSNWFSQGLVRPGRVVRKVLSPGVPGVGHQWAYLPDVARTMARLLVRREELASFSTFQMAGHWDPDGSLMTGAIRRVVARRTGVEPRVSDFPWWLLTLASPFVATFREMQEMRYLWRVPIRMDNARLEAVLGDEPHTPLDEAVEATLRELGCLDARASAGWRPSGPVSLE